MLLQLEKIGKSFNGIPVLHEASLDLKAGEVHVLAGENGAGKSTLIKIVSGVYPDYRGRILLAGKTLRLVSPRQAHRHGIAVIHQEMSLVGSLSVLDNVFLGREKTHGFSLLDRPRQLRQAERLLSDLQIDVDPGKPVSDYPLSVQQMIEIAKALAGEARVIMMDEPTSALSESETERLFRLIGQLKDKGCGIIFISHRMDEIYRLADRITVLRDGRGQGTYFARDLPTAELIRHMVGREIVQLFPDRQPVIGDEVLRVERFAVPDPSRERRLAVRGIDFHLRQGEILGLAGLQGSGKSELLQGLFGAMGKAPSGRVFLAGQPLRIIDPVHALRSGIALLTSDRKTTGIIPALDVMANISLASLRRFSRHGWMLKKNERRESKRFVSDLAIKTASLDAEAGTLSGGNQQKTLLARWLQTKPRVFLMDEPTRGVDIGAKQDIYELLNRLTREGMAILLTASELPELLALSDRILVLHRGLQTAEIPRPLFSQERILRAALGEPDSA